MVMLASFYAPRLDHPKHVYDYLDCLAVQRDSCERFGVRQIVITDAGTDHVADRRPFHCFRTALPQELMPAILAGQLALLESGIADDDDLLLTGADCLLTRSPDGVLQGASLCDLAVTTHPFADCILNTGLIMVPAGKAKLVAPFWAEALARCGSRWGDDQLALASVIEPTLSPGIERRRGRRVMFLPCDRFNAAPASIDHPCDALIAHFRGPRKVWMRAWASRHAA